MFIPAWAYSVSARVDNSESLSRHAGAHDEKDHILPAPARAVLPFHQRAGIGVVLQKGGNAEGVLKNLHDGHIVPAGQIVRGLHDACARIQGAAAADAMA